MEVCPLLGGRTLTVSISASRVLGLETCATVLVFFFFFLNFLSCYEGVRAGQTFLQHQRLKFLPHAAFTQAVPQRKRRPKSWQCGSWRPLSWHFVSQDKTVTLSPPTLCLQPHGPEGNLLKFSQVLQFVGCEGFPPHRNA